MSHAKTPLPPCSSRLHLLVLAVALLAPACVDTFYYTSLVASPRPLSSRPVDQLDLFVITPPARPHTNLGLLQIIRGQPDHGVPEMMTELRQKAAEIGCDALLVTSIDNQETKYQAASVQGSCIVYNDVATAQPATAKAPVAPGPAAPPPGRPPSSSPRAM